MAKFRRWRRMRPFWGGLFLLLSGIQFFLSSNLSLGGIEVHLGPTGFLSYLIPLLVLLCGLLSWFSPGQRLFYGIIAMATALYSLIGLNLGGFFVGMLLGIVGGALVIAWGPPRVRPDDTASPSAAAAASESESASASASPTSPSPSPSPSGDSGDDSQPDPSGPSEPPEQSEPPTERIPIAGHDDRPTEELRPAIVPGMEPEEPRRRTFGGGSSKALAVGLVAAGVTAGLLVAGGGMPARAEVECPEGLPSRSSSPSSPSSLAPSSSLPSSSLPSSSSASSSSRSSSRSASSPSSSSPSDLPVPPLSGADSPEGGASSPSPSGGGGNPILGGINGFVDGVGDLLGIRGDPSSSESPSPSVSPPSSPSSLSSASSPSSSATTSISASASAGSSRTDGPSQPVASGGAASASPDPSDSEIPCLGARIYGKVAENGDLPFVAEKPGRLEVRKLTMTNSAYEGVADMPTKTRGTFKALQFTMDRAVNEGFTLTIDEKHGGQTVITSAVLTTDKNVRFYTPKFQGKLFGLIPVTFTPERPPPLTLPTLIFTDVTIELAYVRCDTLTGKPLQILEKP